MSTKMFSEDARVQVVAPAGGERYNDSYSFVAKRVVSRVRRDW